MMPAERRRTVHFESGGECCAALLYPGTNGAGVIMAPGLGVTKEAGCDRHAAALNANGFTVLAFDYRRFGESGGRPRHVAKVSEQLADWDAAIAYGQTLGEVDPARWGVWAYSLSGAHILPVAARHPELAAAILISAPVDGAAAARGAMRHQRPGALLRLTGRGIRDAVGGRFGAAPRLVPLTGERGTVAMLSAPDALLGPAALRADEHPEWEQVIAARSALRVGFYRPGRFARRVQCPLLVVSYEDDQLAVPRCAVRAGERAPRGEVVSRPGGHFEFLLEDFDEALALQLGFLERHLLDRKRVALPSGTIECVDTGGDGPVVVLVHGLLMDETLWDDVVSLLGAGHRCVVPILPLGAHRLAMGPGADLSLRGQARLVRELLEDLDLRDVTIVGNDTGGAIVQLLMASGEERIGQAVLVSCDAFDNVPPGLTGKTIVALGKLAPSLFGAFVQQLRARPLRRLPFSFGWLTKRGDRTVRGWLRPLLGDRAIRRDAVGVLRGIGNERDVLVGAEPGLRRWDRPALVVWAAQDRVMPPEHGRRLAELLGAALVEIDDSHTLVPLDQPQALAAALREFITAKRAAEPEPARHRAPAEVRWEPA